MVYNKGQNSRRIKSISKLLAGFFCMFITIFILSMEALAADGVIKATSANIRSSADPKSTILASVLKGDKLTIKEQVTGTDGQTWYKVFIDANTLGFVRGDLLDKSGDVPQGTDSGSTLNSTETPAKQPSTPANNSVDTNVSVNQEGTTPVQPVSGSVIKDQVRVRGDSSTSAGIVTSIKKDVAITVNATKVNDTNETWYLVSFTVNDANVTGYVRSDFVSLSGELLPVVDEPEPTPEETEPEPEPEPVQPMDYETKQEDDVWYLYDNLGSAKYQISKLITTAQQNAADLVSAQKKVSSQNVIIIILAVLLVILTLGITLLIFKMKDVMDGEGFDLRDSFARKSRPSGSPVRKPLPRPASERPMPNHRIQGQSRPASSGPATRPVGQGTAQRQVGNGQNRPAGSGAPQRPVGNGQSRPVGNGAPQRPVGNGQSRPAGSGAPQRPVGNGQNRPAGSGAPQRPMGNGQPRPNSEHPQGRPVQRPNGVHATSSQIENQARENLDTRNMEKDNAEAKSWKSKNFMTDDDEFEFEFLNWDGEEDKK